MRNIDLSDVESGPIKAYYIGTKDGIESNTWYWVYSFEGNLFVADYEDKRRIPVDKKYLFVPERTTDGVEKC